MPDEGIHVGSGTFRVNPKRALELLSRHQLPDPAMFVDLWLRLAQASGARRVEVTEPPSGFRLAFDGRPLAEGELRDPFACVFVEPAPRRARLRELAYGLLAVLKTGPADVSIFSGSGGKGWRLRVESLERWSLEPAEAEGTCVEVAWASSREVPPPQWRARLAGLPAMLGPRLEVDGEWVPAAPAPEPHVAFRRGRARGFLFVNRTRLSPNSLLKLHRLGLPVESIYADMPVRVCAFVNDDGLTLDASQAGVVRDERLAWVETLVAERCVGLVPRVLEGFSRRFQETVPLLADEEVLRCWVEGWPAQVQSGQDPGPAPWLANLNRRAGGDGSPRPPAPSAGAIHRSSKAHDLLQELDWLHDAAQRLLVGPEGPAPDPLRAALRSAPLFLGASGGGVSLQELDRQLDALGCVPYRRRPDPAAPPGVVWCPSHKDLAWLTKRYGARIREER